LSINCYQKLSLTVKMHIVAFVIEKLILNDILRIYRLISQVTVEYIGIEIDSGI